MFPFRFPASQHRRLLLVSTVLNLALAGWLAGQWVLNSRPAKVEAGQPSLGSNLAKDRSAVASPTLAGGDTAIWPRIESTNYIHYIRNLRQVGCPESTVADIIVADVGQLFTDARSHAREAGRQRGDSEAAVANELRALEQREEAVLDELLGPSWRRSRRSAEESSPSDLDWMPSELAAKVRAIERQGDDEAEAIRAQARTALTADDRAALRNIELRRDEQLLAVLGAEGLADYRFRASGAAEALSRLPGVAFSDEGEMRRVFELENAAERQRELLADDSDRAEEARQIDLREAESLKALLGEERYARLLRGRDFRFQQLNDLATRFGLEPTVAEQVYALHQGPDVAPSGAAADEPVARVANWTGQLPQTERDHVQSLLGDQAFAAYQEVARDW